MDSHIRALPLSDGHSIPELCIGTGTQLKILPKDVMQQPIISALEHGVIHIDAAQHYQNEEHVGAALAAFLASSKTPRESVYITTKLDTLAPGQTPLETLQISLEKLQLKYVDLFLVHSPSPFLEEGVLEKVWRGMEEIKDKGYAKSIGVSNFRIKEFERILKGAKHKPVVNQIEFHPYVYKASQPLLAFQAQHDIVTESYGGLSPLFRHHGVSSSLPSVLQEIAQRIGKGATEGQILLRWLSAKGVVAVTTTNKPARLKEYLVAYELPDLTKEDIAAIEKAGEEVHSRHFQQHMDEP